MRLLMLAAVAAALPLASPVHAQPVAQPATAAPTRFSVVVEGSGPDVILIPGLTSSREVWSATAARLKADHRLHLIQVAGFAGEPAGANATGAVVAPLAEEIAQYIAAQKLVHPAVIGHSLGGEVALMLAARHPDAVGRVMAVDALPFYSLIMNPAATVDSVRPQAAAFRDAMAAMTPEQAAAAQDATTARLVKTQDARPQVSADGLASDRGVAARAAYELMTTDLRPELPKITAPLTVLYSYDPLYGVPPAQIDALFARAYAGASTARLRRVDDSFHFIMLDQPARFGEAVDRFLD